MSMDWLLFILLGLVAGAMSGLVGIGGGIIIVPALVMLFGFSQKLAQGTTLALLVPPIGILAAYTYYKHGDVNIYAAGFIIVGFVAGSLIGARYVANLSNATVVRIFGAFLLFLALRMLVSAKA
ncbi:MAG TPA: sulfite exporter TauE/SafE family protein [Candidatus Saccharimonadia bacterium]|nr:sulfite exporter TauE/SafE family protein [Candidatus Saccharimonadia bacterium]